jgi:hypothetical protein
MHLLDSVLGARLLNYPLTAQIIEELDEVCRNHDIPYILPLLNLEAIALQYCVFRVLPYFKYPCMKRRHGSPVLRGKGVDFAAGHEVLAS